MRNSDTFQYWKEQVIVIRNFLKVGEAQKRLEPITMKQPIAADDFVRQHINKYLHVAFESTLSNSVLIERPHLELNLALGHAQTFDLMGQSKKALELYQRAVKLASTLKLKAVEAETYRKMGRLRRSAADIKGALKDFEHSFSMFQMLEDYRGVASTLNSLGTVYLETGKLEKAEEHFESALSFAELANDIKLIAQINNHIGVLANIRGDWQKAIVRYQASLPRFEKIGHVRGMAQTYHNLGMTFLDKGDTTAANDYFDKSLELSFTVGDIGLATNTYLNKIEVYIITHDYFMALGYCKKTLESFLQLSDYAGIAEVCKFLGTISSQNKNWSLSQQYYRLSLSINKRINNILNMAETQFAFGQAYLERNKKDSGLKILKSSLENFRSLKANSDIKKVKQAIDRLQRT